jgi:hypothetical protein
MFVVRPGIYHIPNFGKLDTRKKVSNAQYLALYENKDFPFITISEEVIPFLKKEKLSEKRLINLIQQATSANEVNWLLEVKTSKKLKAIAETKLNTF